MSYGDAINWRFVCELIAIVGNSDIRQNEIELQHASDERYLPNQNNDKIILKFRSQDTDKDLVVTEDVLYANYIDNVKLK